MAQDNPYAKYLTQQEPARQPDPIVRPVDPYKGRADARAEEAARRAAEADKRAADAAARATAEWNAQHNPDGSLRKPEGGGRALSDATAKRIESGVGMRDAMTGAAASFQDDFAGNTITGGLENMVQSRVDSFGTPGQNQWWANFKSTDNQIRNDLFGSALTPTEKQAYEGTTVSPSMDPKQVRTNLAKRRDILKGALDRQRRFMLANGYNQEAINIIYEPLGALDELAGSVEGGDAPPAIGGAQNPPAGGTPPQGNGPPVFSPGDPQMQANTSGFRQEDDPALVQRGVSGAFAGMLAQSVAPGEAVTKLRELGVTDPIVLRDAARQLEFRRKNPNVPLDKYTYPAIDDKAVPLSGFESAVTEMGANPVGAYFANAGQFLSGNTLDNLASDPERARASMDVISQQNPTASALGQVSGGVMASMGGEGLLARAGAAPGFLRGLAADVGMGAANGAGMADGPGQSRGMNALVGGATAGAGNLAGNALVRGAARAISPSGGNLNALYEAGVRPTPGQRYVNSGIAGRALNATEEAFQSIPIVGAAIGGARQGARDQFQIGAFNEALREVGETLPKGMPPGTAPHAYAQKTFDRVYAEARGGMRLQGDEALADDLGALDEGVRTLAEPAQKRFNAIFKNVVARRVNGGELAGAEYKKAISELGKQARSIRNNPNGDHELASALEDLQGVLDNAARRHSDPEAVALLDAADAGYAKLVRIEDAAQRAGGDAGTFSPSQFERSVQKTSGGTRSKSFLRGDALMQDYAEQGKNLVDRMPNSGTTDRSLAVGGLAAGGAAYVSPAIGAFLGAVGLGYSPLARKALTGTMAPSGPKAKAIAAQLRKRAALVGKASAATGAAFLPGTSPGQ